MTGGRTLTVLVADLTDSTRLSISLGPERADEVRRSVFSRFESAAARHNGNLVKTMGDGCLITYAAASEGVAAGLELVDAINRLGRQIPGLRLRVGIAVGDLTEEGGDVFGEAVVLARRVCDAATPGQVLVTDFVRALAGSRGNLAWQRVGELFLKGIDEPVPCSVARQSTSLEPEHRLPRALRTRAGEFFVGRAALLDSLITLFKESAAGDPRVVVVAGEPGAGKTRLVAAAARIADADGALVLFGRCEEDLALPYQPFVDALRPAVEAAPRDVLAAHVDTHGGEIRRLFPFIHGPDPISATPEVEQARVTAALADLLTRLAHEQPLVLVVDDIHWAAPTTVQALRHLVSTELGAPVFVLATVRDTEPPSTLLDAFLADVVRSDHAQRIALDGLNRSEVEELIEALSAEPLNDASTRLAAAVFEHTAGNSFFVNQVLRHLAETGAVVFRDGRWEPASDLTDMPAGVVEVVGQRLARLEPRTRDLLSVAAVAGERFTHALIGRAAHVDNVEAALQEALSARVLVDDGRGGYRFFHAIVRDAVLATQPAAVRAAHHRDIALTLRTIYGDGPTAPLHDLAYHACGAAGLGMTAEAARFSLAAAEASVRRADVGAAISVLTRCWRTLDDLDPLDHVARFDVCVRLAELHYATLDGQYDALEAAAESARALASPERLIRASLFSYRWDIATDDAYATKMIEEGLATLPPGPSELRALGLASGANFMNMQAHGDPREWTRQAFAMIDELGGPTTPDLRLAFEYAVASTSGQPGVRRVVERIEAADGAPYSPRVQFRTAPYMGTKAESYLRAGNREGSLAVIRTIDAIAGTSGDPNMEGWSLTSQVIWALAEARYDDAASLAQRAMRRVGVQVPNLAAVAVVGTIWTAYEQGNSALVIDLIRATVEGMPEFHGMRAGLAVHLCELGRFDEARAEVKFLVDFLPRIPRNVSFGCVIGLAAEAAAQAGCVEYAALLLAELEPFRGEIIALPANVFLGATERFTGALRYISGDKDGAAADLQKAIAMEESLGAVAWLARSRRWLERVSSS